VVLLNGEETPLPRELIMTFFTKGIDLFDVKINDVHEVLEVNF
jgi:hypothetical protein